MPSSIISWSHRRRRRSDGSHHGKVEGIIKQKNRFGHPVSMAPLGAIKPYCQAIVGRIRASGATGPLRVYEGWITKLEKPKNQTIAEMSGALAQVEQCYKLVDKALADGVPATTEIELKKLGRITLGEARVKVCDGIKEAGEKVKAAIATKIEAKIAPFRKVLKGDRMRIFEARDMAFSEIRGHGGKWLETPEDFARSDVWYETIGDANGLLYRWTTRGFRFKGDRQVGSPTERSGLGRNAPAGPQAYP